MDDVYHIPAGAELRHMVEAESLRPTLVEVTLKVTGGAIMDGEAIIFNFPRVELKEAGHMKIRIEEESVEDVDYSWDSLPPEPDKYLHLTIDRARLVPNEHRGSVYTMRVEKEN